MPKKEKKKDKKQKGYSGDDKLPEVSVSLSRTIKVSDNGIGIPEFAKNRIFTRFYSVPHPDTGKRGNGLGLRFAKKIMDLHDGSITLTNRAMTKGAEAVFKFPKSTKRNL